ncbi:MAG: type 4a pilus biogenesis protein PilO [Chitinispirillales bacterium]|nr:type 4a pilus biogenesis protein PilO [Chitinispirillales bacterium]
MRNAAVKRLTHDAPVTALFSAAGLICCAALVFIAVPQWSEYKERTARIKHYDTFISSSEGFDKMRRELELKNEILKSKLAGASTRILSHSVSGVLEELIIRSKESGVVLAKIQPQAETKSGNSVSVPVLLESTTDYYKLSRFIASVETLPEILQISRIAVETNRSGELNVKLLVTCLVGTEGGG